MLRLINDPGLNQLGDKLLPNLHKFFEGIEANPLAPNHKHSCMAKLTFLYSFQASQNPLSALDVTTFSWRLMSLQQYTRS